MTLEIGEVRPEDLKGLSDDEFEKLFKSTVSVLREDTRQNQIKYYKPASDRARSVHFSNAKWVGVSGGNGSSKSETCLVHFIALATGVFPEDPELFQEFKRQFRGPIICRIVLESHTTVLTPIFLPKLKWHTWTGTDQQFGEKGHWGWVPKSSLIDGSWDKSWTEKTKILTVLCRDPDTGEVLGKSTIQFMCFRGDQRARMADNTWVPVKDLKIGDVLKHPSGGTTKVTQTYQYEDAEMVRVRCRGGKELIVTPNHKHPLKDGRLLRTDQLSIGDVLITNKDRVVNDFGYLAEWALGWTAIMIGDGYIKAHSATFTASPSGRVMKDLPPLPPDCHLVKVRTAPGGAVDYSVSLIKARRGNPLVKFLKRVDLWGRGSGDKFIPEMIFKEPDKSKGFFLKHLWNTDGTINRKGRQACYVTISKRLAYDVKYLLWSLGIKASSHLHKGICGFTGKKIEKYHTLVSGCSFDRFIEMYEGRYFANVKYRQYGVDGQITHIDKMPNAPAYCVDVDAEDHLFIVDGLATHNSKSQDPEDFASGDFHLVLHDEPPLYTQWRENQARTMRVNGRIFLSFTWPDDASIPVDWIFDELYDKQKEPNYDWFELWTTDNIHLNQDSIAEQAAEWSEETKRVRLFGGSMRFSNRVHPLFTDTTTTWCFTCNENAFLVKDKCEKCGGENLVEYNHVHHMEYQKWPIVFLLDPHPRKPHMFLWAEITPSDDIRVIADGELSETPESLAKFIFDFEEERGFHIACRLIDPNMGRSPSGINREITWQDEFDKSGLMCELANDSSVGRKTVDQFLKPDKHTQMPRIVISEECQSTIYQMKRYVWQDFKTSQERDLKQIPRDKYDDYPTLLKYLVNYNPQFNWLHSGAPTIKRPGTRKGAY